MPEPETKPSQTESLESPVLAVVDRAHEEIAWVRSAYKFAVSFIAILIAIGLYFSHKSIQDLKSELRADGEKIQEQLRTESSLLSRTLRKNLEEEATRIRGDVTTRIEKQFKQENISKLVAKQAQTRIDAIADNLIEGQIVEQIAPLKKELTKLIAGSSDELKTKVKELDNKITQSKATEEELRALLEEARKIVDNVKGQSEFVLTVMAAQSDDRNAYQKLIKWSDDNTLAMHNQAKAAVFNIQKSLYAIGSDVHMTLNWKEGFDPSNMSLSDIKDKWRAIPSHLARAYVEFVWNHKDLTKDEKLSFLYDAISDSRGSIQAAHWAAKTLAKEAGVKYNPPFDFSAIKEWWSERNNSSTTSKKTTNKIMDINKK